MRGCQRRQGHWLTKIAAAGLEPSALRPERNPSFHSFFLDFRDEDPDEAEDEDDAPDPAASDCSSSPAFSAFSFPLPHHHHHHLPS